MLMSFGGHCGRFGGTHSKFSPVLINFQDIKPLPSNHFSCKGNKTDNVVGILKMRITALSIYGVVSMFLALGGYFIHLISSSSYHGNSLILSLIFFN